MTVWVVTCRLGLEGPPGLLCLEKRVRGVWQEPRLVREVREAPRRQKRVTVPWEALQMRRGEPPEDTFTWQIWKRHSPKDLDRGAIWPECLYVSRALLPPHLGVHTSVSSEWGNLIEAEHQVEGMAGKRGGPGSYAARQRVQESALTCLTCPALLTSC